MNRISIVIGSLFLAAAPAAVQAQAQAQGIDWNLLGPPVNYGEKVQEGWERGQRQRAMQEQQQAVAEQRQADADQRLDDMVQRSQQRTEEADAQNLGVSAGKLVAAGDCAGAESLALNAGDFNLAKTVREYCAARP